jgi:hypothetical protein
MLSLWRPHPRDHPCVSHLFRKIRDRKLMTFACFHDEQPATTCASLARNRVIEVAMFQPFDNDLFNMCECIRKFAMVSSRRCRLAREFIHSGAAPSSLDNGTGQLGTWTGRQTTQLIIVPRRRITATHGERILKGASFGDV